MNFNKLKSQKGLTGIDVVIAITIISATTIAIMAIYVNLIVNSKKATRNSAATRIATSILSNIDYMYYADVEKELHRINNYNGTSLTFDKEVYDTKIFNTKITSGYKVKISATEISNTTDKLSVAEGGISNCPLILDIKVTVSYEASGKKQSITLKTVKKREILEECNAPNLNDLIGCSYNNSKLTIKSLNQIQPIKWSNAVNGYVKTTESDDWYNYSNREWAKVVVLNEFAKFDSSTGVIDLNTSGVKVYVWIPRCGISTNEENFAFAYGSSNDAIHEISIRVNTSDYFLFNGIKRYSQDTHNFIDSLSVGVNPSYFPEGKTGIWLCISGGETFSASGVDNNFFEKINITNTDYYPPATHLGKNFY